MSSIKRRQIIKDSSVKQTKLNFPEQKSYDDLAQVKQNQKRYETRGFESQNGAKDSVTTFRSYNRLN
jgi:hypothetical protein